MRTTRTRNQVLEDLTRDALFFTHVTGSDHFIYLGNGFFELVIGDSVKETIDSCITRAKSPLQLEMQMAAYGNGLLTTTKEVNTALIPRRRFSPY